MFRILVDKIIPYGFDNLKNRLGRSGKNRREQELPPEVFSGEKSKLYCPLGKGQEAYKVYPNGYEGFTEAIRNREYLSRVFVLTRSLP